MTDVTLQDIAGILGDTQWDTSGTNNLTFSFPTAASNYGDFYGAEDGFGGNGEPYTGFQPLTPEQQDVVRHDLGLISQYTLLTFTEVTETDDSGAVLRFAESAVPDPATFYSPSQFFGGDVWFGNVYFDDLTKGSYGYSTTLQLIGDVLGLKAGPDPYPYGVLPPEHNSLEWSVMSFSSYIGADPSFYLANDGSGNQTYMINDIAALQYMYGANFNTNAGNTVYSWSPSTGETFIDGVGQGASTTNTVFAAIWDGGGTTPMTCRTIRPTCSSTSIPGSGRPFPRPSWRIWMSTRPELTWQRAISPTPICTTTTRARSSKTPLAEAATMKSLEIRPTTCWRAAPAMTLSPVSRATIIC